MIDQNKIILMTKMAQYEKNHMKKDKRITDYFIEDYVYLNNFKTRLAVMLVTVFFIGIGTFQIVTSNIIFPTSLEQFLEIYINPYVYPWLMATIIYTIISTLVYSARYTKANKRMSEYKHYVKELKRYEKRQASTEGATDEI